MSFNSWFLTFIFHLLTCNFWVFDCKFSPSTQVESQKSKDKFKSHKLKIKRQMWKSKIKSRKTKVESQVPVGNFGA